MHCFFIILGAAILAYAAVTPVAISIQLYNGLAKGTGDTSRVYAALSPAWSPFKTIPSMLQMLSQLDPATNNLSQVFVQEHQDCRAPDWKQRGILRGHGGR